MFPLHDNNPITRWPFVTVLLVVANVVSFLYLAQLPHNAQQKLVIERGFIPATIQQLSNPRLIVQVDAQELVQGPLPNQLMLVKRKLALPPDPQRIYASLLTTMFLHGGWMHLIGNMWFLWLFGNNVEDRLGHVLLLARGLAGDGQSLGVRSREHHAGHWSQRSGCRRTGSVCRDLSPCPG
jgi:membrane associated rhomboid family serine protease